MATRDAYEWLDRNMHSNYPIADSCSCMSDSGVVLPTSFLVDIGINVPKTQDGNTNERFFISSIARYTSTIVVEISYHKATGEDICCGRSTPIDISLRNSASIQDRTFGIYPIATNPGTGYSVLRNVSGTLIVGTCQDMVDLGTLSFRWQNGAVSQLLSVRVNTYTPGLNHVSVLYTDSATGTEKEATITDSFTLQAGDGIELEPVTGADGDVTVYVNRVDTAAEAASPYKTVASLLNAVYAELGEPIRRLNGVAPLDGNMTIKGGDCLNVDVSENTISISNPCAKPCCTEESTADISGSLATVEEAVARLATYYETLTTQINLMQSRLASLIASRS